MILDRIYRKEGDREIPGTFLHVYIKNGPHHLTQLKVWQDGVIDCWERVSLKGLEHKLASGWVVTALPEGAEVHVHHLGHFKATEVKSFIAEGELLKEVADLIEELNGRPTAADRVRDALRGYAERQTPENKERLRVAYEAVPAHLRMYLGDMDEKDFPIRVILYGEQELEKWSHRQAARAAKMPEPGIDIPKYLENVTPSPKKHLHGRLQMALLQLYRGNGVEAPLFGLESATEVEELFRTGRVEEAFARMSRDIDSVITAARRRPQMKVRIASVAESLAEFLLGAGDEAQGEAMLWLALEHNPDGLAALRLAALAVRRQDTKLAARLRRELGEVGLPSVPGKQFAKSMKIDIDGFDSL